MLNNSKNLENRLGIINAARALILERGFNAVTLQDLLLTAGITKGKFFHYFESKEQCFSEVLKESLGDPEFLRFDEVIEGREFGSPFKALMFLVDRAIDWHANGLPSSLQICVLATFFFPKNSSEMLRVRSLLIANVAVLESLIAECQTQGELPDVINPNNLAALFPGAGIGGNIVGFLIEGKGRSVDCLRELKNILSGLNSGMRSNTNV